jgi:hypothetical protein
MTCKRLNVAPTVWQVALWACKRASTGSRLGRDHWARAETPTDLAKGKVSPRSWRITPSVHNVRSGVQAFWPEHVAVVQTDSMYSMFVPSV